MRAAAFHAAHVAFWTGIINGMGVKFLYAPDRDVFAPSPFGDVFAPSPFGAKHISNPDVTAF